MRNEKNYTDLRSASTSRYILKWCILILESTRQRTLRFRGLSVGNENEEVINISRSANRNSTTGIVTHTCRGIPKMLLNISSCINYTIPMRYHIRYFSSIYFTLNVAITRSKSIALQKDDTDSNLSTSTFFSHVRYGKVNPFHPANPDHHIIITTQADA